jgi:excisionase family DNA binding protein
LSEKLIIYLTPKKVADTYNITSTTLRNWAESGKLKYIRPHGGKRLYDKADVERVFKGENCAQIPTRIPILYARVSSNGQSQDLERQKAFLKSRYPDDRIISDVSSRVNWKSKGIETILDLIHTGVVEELVVSYKDRLCKSEYELLQWICKSHNTKIVVLIQVSETEDRTAELTEDLLSIVTVFVAKNNGLRASRNRKARAQDEKNKDSPDWRAKKEVKRMV